MGKAAAIFVFADSALGAEPDLAQAQQYYQRAELLKAEPLFLAALPNARGTERPRNHYDRLLSIYYRLSRHDRAVQIGQEYRKWLVEGKDEVRAREVQHQIGTCYLVLGHYGKAREQFREVLRERPDLAPPPPPVRLEALAYLAQIAEKLKQNDGDPQAVPPGRGVRSDVLAKPPASLTWLESVTCVWKLSDCYRILKKPAAAVARLEPLLAGHDAHDDVAGKCETLRMLAGHRTALGGRRAAEKDLRQALDLYAKLDQADRVRLGDLWLDLAAVLEASDRREDRDEARGCRDKAAALFDTVVRGGKDVLPDHQPPEVAFWKLQAAMPARVALQGRLATGRRAGRPLGRRVAGRLAPGGRTRNFEHLSWRF